MVVSLTLNHRRKPTVGRADPPVVPVTDEISPNKNFQFIRGQAFRIVAVIEKLAFHSDPHAFTSSIIVAPAASTVIVNVNDVPKGTFQNHMRLPRSWTSWDFGSIEFFRIPLFAFVVYKLLESYAEKAHFPYPIEILFLKSMRQFYFSSFCSDIYIDYVLLPQVKLLV